MRVAIVAFPPAPSALLRSAPGEATVAVVVIAAPAAAPVPVDATAAPGADGPGAAAAEPAAVRLSAERRVRGRGSRRKRSVAGAPPCAFRVYSEGRISISVPEVPTRRRPASSLRRRRPPAAKAVPVSFPPISLPFAAAIVPVWRAVTAVSEVVPLSPAVPTVVPPSPSPGLPTTSAAVIGRVAAARTALWVEERLGAARRLALEGVAVRLEGCLVRSRFSGQAPLVAVAVLGAAVVVAVGGTIPRRARSTVAVVPGRIPRPSTMIKISTSQIGRGPIPARAGPAKALRYMLSRAIAVDGHRALGTFWARFAGFSSQEAHMVRGRSPYLYRPMRSRRLMRAERLACGVWAGWVNVGRGRVWLFGCGGRPGRRWYDSVVARLGRSAKRVRVSKLVECSEPCHRERMLRRQTGS